jgi:hypothetical protein
VLTPRIRAALVVLAASAGLGACTNMGPYGGIGVGVGSQYGYDPYYSGYGYGGYGGYGIPYGYAGYGSGYGSAYGYDPFGWYNGYYYPGSGYYVYDRDHHRRVMTPEERAFWLNQLRRFGAKTGSTTTTAAASLPTAQQVQENWKGFNRRSVDPATASGSTTASVTGSSRDAWRQRVIEQRAQRAQVSEAREQLRAERAQVRAERFETRQTEAQDRSEARASRRRPKE